MFPSPSKCFTYVKGDFAQEKNAYSHGIYMSLWCGIKSGLHGEKERCLGVKTDPRSNPVSTNS